MTDRHRRHPRPPVRRPGRPDPPCHPGPNGRREATVNELVDAFDLTQPTISKHLKVLERAGLISRGREAQFRPVRLDARRRWRGRPWLGDYRRFWEESLEQLDDSLKQLKDKDAKTTR